jgi:hypothetical protein
MISAQEIERAMKASEGFQPAVIAARYHPESDRVELVTAWCVLFVDRARIDELRGLSPHDLESISVSATGIHVSGANLDINAAGLITDISKQLESDAANSF